jgi:hypothetical protein
MQATQRKARSTTYTHFARKLIAFFEDVVLQATHRNTFTALRTRHLLSWALEDMLSFSAGNLAVAMRANSWIGEGQYRRR